MDEQKLTYGSGVKKKRKFVDDYLCMSLSSLDGGNYVVLHIGGYKYPILKVLWCSE
jgi:hypothetical protein